MLTKASRRNDLMQVELRYKLLKKQHFKVKRSSLLVITYRKNFEVRLHSPENPIRHKLTSTLSPASSFLENQVRADWQRREDIRHHDIQHKDTKYDDPQHNNSHYLTMLSIRALIIATLTISKFSMFTFTKRRSAKPSIIIISLKN